jgi:cellobiose phosphorylase
MRYSLFCFFKRNGINFLTVVKIYTVSRDGALFVWSCSKEIDDITMKDKNNIDEDSGSKMFLNSKCSSLCVRKDRFNPEHFKHPNY